MLGLGEEGESTGQTGAGGRECHPLQMWSLCYTSSIPAASQQRQLWNQKRPQRKLSAPWDANPALVKTWHTNVPVAPSIPRKYVEKGGGKRLQGGIYDGDRFPHKLSPHQRRCSRAETRREDSGTRQPVPSSWLLPLIRLWPWASHLATLFSQLWNGDNSPTACKLFRREDGISGVNLGVAVIV